MRHLILTLAAILGIAHHAPAFAGATQCSTKIDGEPVTIVYHRDDPSYSSFRERWLTRSATCPGAVVVTYLMPDLTAEERAVFCANYDAETRSFSQPAQGPRDAYGRCTEPSKTCALVNTTKDEAMALMGLGQEAEGGRLRDRMGATLSAVTHSSGAMILSGNGSALASLAAQTGAVLASPAVMAGAAASVVVIGGAVYLCND
ncbi:MAG: hypothetical protein EA339_14470 [Rhodobacteraceae bacterium]|nr:MAG: hypothetical protein EA339_14470 [Paracoccaceae bacterium]